jgi:hypothetical protein
VFATWLRIAKTGAPHFGKISQVRNRSVEFDEISGQKTSKVGINHLTILIQHGWLHLTGAGWTTLARQVHSKYFIMSEAPLRPGA